MKYRSGFVTNSSSSSFLAIWKEDTLPVALDTMGTYIIGKQGETKFEKCLWRAYTNFHDKVNFCAIFVAWIYYGSYGSECREWIDKAIRDYTGCETVDWTYLEKLVEAFDAYIDHNDREIVKNIIQDEVTLRQFLSDKSVLFFGSDDDSSFYSHNDKVVARHVLDTSGYTFCDDFYGYENQSDLRKSYSEWWF